MSDDSDSDYSESESGSSSGSAEEPVKDDVCKLCKRKFANKYSVMKHMKNCGKFPALNKCMWCNLQFTNRGNLATHAFHIHGDSSYKVTDGDKEKVHHCNVCSKTYKLKKLLTYHIRRHHFNLQAKIPYAERKKVNQVWFEKVLNSNKILEIKKASENTLIMRGLDENTGIKVPVVNDKVIDLSNIYPVDRHSIVTCDLCQKSFQKRNFKKHYEEIHLNKKKMHCNNCNQVFKRAYQFLQHRCHVVRNRGIKHGQEVNLRIASVESLSIPM
ncbi:zinc finger protein 568-like isoform X2 [Pectinophora gossypiella]|uniref:zinc finger protein 568-like isoform X2 n=1 Tax=Pectinophora gossypiella TaxID=13191 RepID=UPI00214ED63C|nr:zinc finger protein 568-like isoform X2 [Pectinophora gossypiella]